MDPYVCVSCGTPTPCVVERIALQLRLRKCTHCGADTDPYVEMPLLLVVLDLLLFRGPAFAHIIYNRAVFTRALTCGTVTFPDALSPLPAHKQSTPAAIPPPPPKRSPVTLLALTACLLMRAVCAAMAWYAFAIPRPAAYADLAALLPPMVNSPPWPAVWCPRPIVTFVASTAANTAAAVSAAVTGTVTLTAAALPEFLTTVLTPAVDAPLRTALSLPPLLPATVAAVSAPHLLAVGAVTLAADVIFALVQPALLTFALRPVFSKLTITSTRTVTSAVTRTDTRGVAREGTCEGAQASAGVAALVLARATGPGARAALWLALWLSRLPALLAVAHSGDPWLPRVADALLVALLTMGYLSVASAATAALVVSDADAAADSRADGKNDSIASDSNTNSRTVNANSVTATSADSGRVLACVLASVALRFVAAVALSAVADWALAWYYSGATLGILSAASATASLAENTSVAWSAMGRVWGDVSVCTGPFCANLMS